MNSKIYKFDMKVGVLDNKLYGVRDYWQYYTTGVESVGAWYPEALNYATRENAERPEQIMYNRFNDADLADMFVALNNQNYIWATPFSLDAFQDAVDMRISYITYLMRDRIDDENVEKSMRVKAEADIYAQDTLARTVFVPDRDNVAFLNRRIKEYFENRTVK